MYIFNFVLRERVIKSDTHIDGGSGERNAKANRLGIVRRVVGNFFFAPYSITTKNFYNFGLRSAGISEFKGHIWLFPDLNTSNSPVIDAKISPLGKPQSVLSNFRAFSCGNSGFFCNLNRFFQDKFLPNHEQALKVNHDAQDEGKKSNRIVESFSDEPAASRALARMCGYGFFLFTVIGFCFQKYRSGIVGYVFLLLSLPLFFMMLLAASYG